MTRAAGGTIAGGLEVTILIQRIDKGERGGTLHPVISVKARPRTNKIHSPMLTQAVESKSNQTNETVG